MVEYRTIPLSSAADATADILLNNGASGLLYFEEYLPRYNKCFASLGIGCGEIALLQMSSLYTRYDVERGMDIAALEQMAVTMGRLVTATKVELDSQTAQRAALPSVWQGQAGDAAWLMLDSQVKRAEVGHAEVSALSSVLTKAAAGLREIIEVKARIVESYWHPTLPDIPDRNGRSREEIDKFFDTARNDRESEEGREAERWLRETFAAHVEETVASFEQVCSSAEAAVRQLYDDLIIALNGVDTAPYPVPAEMSTVNAGDPRMNNSEDSSRCIPGGSSNTNTSNNGSGKNTVNNGGSKNASDDGSENTSNDCDNKNTSEDSDKVTSLNGLESLGQTLASAASALADGLEPGLTSLGELITEGIDDALTKAEAAIEDQEVIEGRKAEDPDDSESEDGDTDGKKDAEVGEFDLAGRHFTLEVGADGRPKLVETDADGTSREYSVTLDENGDPTIVSDESAKDDDTNGVKEADAEEGKKQEPRSEDKSEPPAHKPDEGSTGQPSASPGLPSRARRHEDGEHTPTIVPLPGTPENPTTQQPDSGALLAEAGPL
ncbi:hypothetical protein OG225_39085 [Nocardia sp. NBC_01377]|uniref:hypothetical protein n=1 Tax=Nocardia sp. NBC_01377 TaxID=2903595 RepID=UPI00325512D8